MTETSNAYEAELRSLLNEVRDHPERDHSAKRERIAVLRNLIGAGHEKVG